MIKSKADYKYYLEADRLGNKQFNRKTPRLFLDIEWRYLRKLRQVEYTLNCKKGFLGKVLTKFRQYQLYKLGIKTGFSIYPNSFGPGLALFHYGTIIVNGSARIGKDCQLYCSTNIADGVIIGDKVFIAPGVKVLNNVTIADGVRIGANSVVNKSITEPNITIAGTPAKKVSDKGTSDHYVGGTEKYKELYS